MGPRTPALPYGAEMTKVLDPLDVALKRLNRWLVLPALRAGLGPIFSTPLTGSMLLLRTTGRSSGATREAPLGYVVTEGAIYICAGFGKSTAWYRNLQANKAVEIVLPSGVAVAGDAETVTEEAEWSRVFPRYVTALGLIGTLTLGRPRELTPERRALIRETLPLVRIRPVGIASGPADPGGWMWLLVQGAIAWALLAWFRRRLERRWRPRHGAVAGAGSGASTISVAGGDSPRTR